MGDSFITLLLSIIIGIEKNAYRGYYIGILYYIIYDVIPKYLIVILAPMYIVYTCEYRQTIYVRSLRSHTTLKYNKHFFQTEQQ